jgi:hypothetical protein
VSRIDNLEFLSDVVPRTTTYKKYVEQRGMNFKPGDSVSEERAKAAGLVEVNGASQVSRPSHESTPRPQEEPVDDGDEMEVDGSIQEQLAMEMGRNVNGS